MNTTRLKLSTLFAEVKPIAGANPFGFTVDKNLQPITKGFSVASALTQDSFGDEGLARVLAIVFKQPFENFAGAGGWLNTDNGEYYYDAVKVFKNEQVAKAYAQTEKQLAIFDLSAKEELKLMKYTSGYVYRDWVNNFLTVERFAEYWEISKEQATRIIERQRILNEL